MERIQFFISILPEKLSDNYSKTILKVKLNKINGIDYDFDTIEEKSFLQLKNDLIAKYGYNYGNKVKHKKTKRVVKCFTCNKFGHISTSCPFSKKSVLQKENLGTSVPPKKKKRFASPIRIHKREGS